MGRLTGYILQLLTVRTILLEISHTQMPHVGRTCVLRRVHLHRQQITKEDVAPCLIRCLGASLLIR